ncbi:hypothetical protein NUC16_004455 [Salmonella enterica]|uniref:Uncharacterized protein n=2 Tax=Salmonella enterica TaxID=28901 RepID=A0A7T8J9M1_SALET|nr:hypothetical protein N898_15485 [Salmonella enterica subsp. arizonae serovar 62:z36:- str. RKS2983]EAN1748529.1 hypothetical protein [Salmonella enterica]EAO6000292.1 hypothetical protein [Salmonella enterica subsp. arizonae serovar 62:z36:-]EBD1258877.1 hypothetical protein [Salmonella enterica subsp. arizonae serovar 62:z4,z32:-]ECG1411757.1 hypothetical protein [Salmonella enterica subsp. arizonae str. CFSAN000560]ECG8549755.1 hypothetical protein [Salmonella enterica subsp. arizonae]ED
MQYLKNRRLVQFYGHAAAKPLSLQAASRKKLSVLTVSKCRLTGMFPARWEALTSKLAQLG